MVSAYSRDLCGMYSLMCMWCMLAYAGMWWRSVWRSVICEGFVAVVQICTNYVMFWRILVCFPSQGPDQTPGSGRGRLNGFQLDPRSPFRVGIHLWSTITVTNRTVPGRQSLSSKPLPNNVTQTQLAILKASHNLKLHAYPKRRKTVLVAACSKERI